MFVLYNKDTVHTVPFPSLNLSITSLLLTVCPCFNSPRERERGSGLKSTNPDSRPDPKFAPNQRFAYSVEYFDKRFNIAVFQWCPDPYVDFFRHLDPDFHFLIWET